MKPKYEVSSILFILFSIILITSLKLLWKQKNQFNFKYNYEKRKYSTNSGEFCKNKI